MATCRIGKALSTPKEFSEGVLNAIDSVLEQVPGSPARAYRQTSIMSHGTTVTTNALVQRSGGKDRLSRHQGVRGHPAHRAGPGPCCGPQRSRIDPLPLVVSGDLVPVMGEYERANTTAIDTTGGLALPTGRAGSL